MTNTANQLTTTYDAGELRELLTHEYIAQSRRLFKTAGYRRINALSQAIAQTTGLTFEEIHYNATQDAEIASDQLN